MKVVDQEEASKRVSIIVDHITDSLTKLPKDIMEDTNFAAYYCDALMNQLIRLYLILGYSKETLLGMMARGWDIYDGTYVPDDDGKVKN